MRSRRLFIEAWSRSGRTSPLTVTLAQFEGVGEHFSFRLVRSSSGPATVSSLRAATTAAQEVAILGEWPNQSLLKSASQNEILLFHDSPTHVMILSGFLIPSMVLGNRLNNVQEVLLCEHDLGSSFDGALRLGYGTRKILGAWVGVHFLFPSSL